MVTGQTLMRAIDDEKKARHARKKTYVAFCSNAEENFTQYYLAKYAYIQASLRVLKLMRRLGEEREK